MKVQEILQSKILEGEKLARVLNLWKFQNKKIVFTNGCFDILHLGHVDYLGKAAGEGDVLVVGVNTDESARRLKGPNRPINHERQRTMLLAALFFVDAVVLFGEDTPRELIRKIEPDVLVKGADYSVDQIAGSDLVLARGGLVKTFELLTGYSTTLMEERIKNAKAAYK